jgi:membrane-associated phospholipid phosphatase
MKIPAIPCVSQGKCCENQVVGMGCGGSGGKLAGTFGGTAPRGKAVAAAGGTTLVAVAAAKRIAVMAAALYDCRVQRPFESACGRDFSRTSEDRLMAESGRQTEPFKAVVPIRQRRIWRDLARILSTIFNPFLTALALFVILAHIGAKDTLDFWRLLFISTFFTSIGPMLYVFRLYAIDRISDLDMSVRAQREMVFTAFVIFDACGAAALWLAHAPRLMIAAMLGYLVSTIVVQYITRYWKISTHAIGITAPLAALTLLYGRQPLPFLVLIPMVCWARVYLKAHTIAQVIAGAALAVATTGFFFSLFHIGLLSAR